MSSTKNPHKIIVILGPTASGKSDLAVKIALRLGSGQAQKYGIKGGEIISADSRQVYRGLDIGSGKVPRDKINSSALRKIYNTYMPIGSEVLYFYRGISHYLLDVANPKRIFTVAQYQKLARRAIRKIWQKNKLPILCGGTGFYIQSVIDGLIIPEVKPNLKLRKILEKKNTEELFRLLKQKDPARAKNIDSQNRPRLIRALEIIEVLGKVPKLKTSPLNKILMFNDRRTIDILMIGIRKEKNELKKLIKKRLIKRLGQGMVAEVRRLHAPPAGGGLSWRRLESFGLEYRYIAQFLQNKISRTEMIKIIEREGWRYAKRQMTWFRRDKRIIWIKNAKEALKIGQKFLKN